MNIKNFKSYWNWREQIKNGDTDLYFKSYLKEMGYKPKKNIEPNCYVNVYVAGSWKRDIPAYKLEQTEKIKKRNNEVRELAVNEENLCKSLYVINKSAKRSRDTKQDNYYQRNFCVVNSSKTRQKNLYELKDQVIKKMYKENILRLVGYHKQFDSKLLLYKNGEYSFHCPTSSKCEGLEYLGEIKEIISSESEKINIGFKEAKLMLETYVNDISVDKCK